MRQRRADAQRMLEDAAACYERAQAAEDEAKRLLAHARARTRNVGVGAQAQETSDELETEEEDDDGTSYTSEDDESEDGELLS